MKNNSRWKMYYYIFVDYWCIIRKVLQKTQKNMEKDKMGEYLKD